MLKVEKAPELLRAVSRALKDQVLTIPLVFLYNHKQAYRITINKKKSVLILVDYIVKNLLFKY